MLAVPEVDDDIDASVAQENTQPVQQETNSDCHTSPLATVDSEEKLNLTNPNQAATSPSTSQTQRSRLSQFHRNTVHICEENGNSS